MKTNQVQTTKALAVAQAAKAAKLAVKVAAQREEKKQADRAARSTLTDAELLKIILRMSDADRSSAFKVMTVLREQEISSSRVRIRRVMAAWVAEQAAKPVRKNGNGR